MVTETTRAMIKERSNIEKFLEKQKNIVKLAKLYYKVPEKPTSEKESECSRDGFHGQRMTYFLNFSYGATMSTDRKRTWFRKSTLFFQSSDPTTIFAKPDHEKSIG